MVAGVTLSTQQMDLGPMNWEIVANHTNEQSLQDNTIFGATNEVTLNNKIMLEKSQEVLLTLALSR